VLDSPSLAGGCGDDFPWGGPGSVGKTASALDKVVSDGRPEIWGGDWNSSFAPKGYAVSKASRTALRSAPQRRCSG